MIASALFVSHSHCPANARVRRRAEALAARGAAVDVLCLRGPDEAETEIAGGVRYVRLPVRHDSEGTLAREVFERTAFFLLVLLVSSIFAIRRRYDLFEAHGTAAPLVFGGLLHRLRGARVLLDLGDPAPEEHAARRGFRWDSWPVRLLRWIEAFSIACSDHALTTSEAFRRRLTLRGIEGSKIGVLIDSVDDGAFVGAAGAPGQVGNAHRFLCRGGPAHRDGLDLALRAVARLKDEIPDIGLDVLGETVAPGEAGRFTRALGLTGRIRFHGRATAGETRRFILRSGLCLAPDRRNSFTEGNLPTWILECLFLGRPVVAARLPGILDYFREDELLYFEPDDEPDLVRVLLETVRNPERTRAFLDRGIAACARLSWEGEEARYLSLVQSLAAAGAGVGEPFPHHPSGTP